MAFGNDRGFSLVELMVSVAIVGILASVGVQNYDQILAKARITRVASELSGIKSAIESIKAAYGYYPHSAGNWRGALPFAQEYMTDCDTFSTGLGGENDTAFREVCQIMSTFNPNAAGMPRLHPVCAGNEPRGYLYLSDGRNYSLLGYCFDRAELSPLAPPNRCGGGQCWGIAFSSLPPSQTW